VITKTGSSLQIQLETTNLNVLEVGTNNVYTRLPYGSETIKVTCTKINCNQQGTLIASVNFLQLPRQGNCMAYAPNSAMSDRACTAQAYSYTLARDDSSSVYQVVCRINETFFADAIGFNLFRLCNF
jgi:hypothetical protein